MSTLASVIIRDVIANLPAAGIAGSLFFATDTLVIMRDNATTWDTIGIGGNATQVNGAAVPASAGVVGSNASNQLIAATTTDIQAAIGASVYDASGAAATAQSAAETYAANASNLSSGTVAVSVLPVATTSTLGVVKPDGSTITISAGVISSSGGGGGTTPVFGYGNPLGASTPVVVQSKGTGGVGGGGSTSLTFASNCSAGNVVFFLYNSGNASPSPSVTDTLGTVYTQLVNFNNGNSTYNLALFAGVLTASGANTLTYTDDRAMGQAYEVSGVTTTIDNALTSTSGTTLTLSVTPNYVNDFLLTFLTTEYDTSSSQSLSSPWSANSSGNSTQYYNVMNTSYQVAGAIAAYPLTWTVTDGDTSNAGLVSFKAASTPVSGTQGQLYFQTSTTPYTEWVYNSGTWNQVA